MRHYYCIWLAVIWLFCMAIPVNAVLEPMSMAMGGANLVMSRGVYGGLANPANLGFSDNGGYSIKYFHFGVMAGNNSFSLEDYNRFSGNFLDEQEKMHILASVPSSGFKARSEADAVLLGMSYGRASLAVNFKTSESISVTEDLFSLLLFGNQKDKTYNLANGKIGEGWTVASAGVAYGQPVKVDFLRELSLGIGIKYLAGIQYVNITGEGDITTTDRGLVGEGAISMLSAGDRFYSPRDITINGSGLAVDLGVAARISQHWFFGASLLDINGGILWAGSIKRSDISLNGSALGVGDVTGLLASNGPSKNVSISGEGFRTSYPSLFNVGLAYNSRILSSEINLQKKIYQEPSSLRDWKICQGMEIRLVPLFPLRAGISALDCHTMSYSAGAGLQIGVFSIDVAASSLGWPGYGIKGVGGSVSLSTEL